jgi:hypothetical protein
LALIPPTLELGQLRSPRPGFPGVLHLGGTANITNTTISGNKTTGFSGGVFSAALNDTATMNILNSIIANNESARLGGGIMTQLGAAVFVKNTIVAGNSIENCNAAQFGGVISSQGNNIRAPTTAAPSPSPPTNRTPTPCLVPSKTTAVPPTPTLSFLAAPP